MLQKWQATTRETLDSLSTGERREKANEKGEKRMTKYSKRWRYGKEEKRHSEFTKLFFSSIFKFSFGSLEQNWASDN